MENKEIGNLRMANLELLRCIAMMMVVVLHFLGKGEILGSLTENRLDSTETAAWLLESFCIVAVNLYMLISGYFLSASSFKLSRLLKLWLQIWMYSAGIGLLAYVLGIYPSSEFGFHYLLTLMLPVSMGHYWFLTAYVFLYLMLPLFGRAIRGMSKGQMQAVLALLLFSFCILKSVVPARLEMDGQGYDVLWYLCVFLTAAYIRRFGWRFLEKKSHGLWLYLMAVLAIFCGTMVLRRIYLSTGKFAYIIKICLEYNHVLPLLAAVGLFGVFLKLKVSGRFAGVVNKIGPYTLGVYLLHENMGVRYVWPKWLGAFCVDSVGSLFLYTAAAAVSVFTVGILADMLRDAVMKSLHRILSKWSIYRRITEKVLGVDEMFRT
ncbi:MAG: acyltransferase [Bacteroidales bacterium]|nr:acyltransferase [Lachnoclostridium sp.]MCM1385072.1 acyltransferase [Lachnoclostridium sp.]MCM1466039.1 acyltransferase [Bacteroidales bacterium]